MLWGLLVFHIMVKRGGIVMSAHNNPEDKSDAKPILMSFKKDQSKQDALDMARAEGEGFNEPAQLESINEAEAKQRGYQTQNKKM
jgi:hypothetical protein